jgi:hypothetical protein
MHEKKSAVRELEEWLAVRVSAGLSVGAGDALPDTGSEHTNTP